MLGRHAGNAGNGRLSSPASASAVPASFPRRSVEIRLKPVSIADPEYFARAVSGLSAGIRGARPAINAMTAPVAGRVARVQRGRQTPRVAGTGDQPLVVTARVKPNSGSPMRHWPFAGYPKSSVRHTSPLGLTTPVWRKPEQR